MPSSPRANLIAACAVAAACGWNLTSVGAVARPLAGHYDSSLGTVGLLGSALWLVHALAQAPAGRAIDRAGVRAVGLGAIALLIVANSAALLTGDLVVLAALRALTGLGCGTTMVAASLRARASGAVGQGAVGGAVSAGAALAVALAPVLQDAIGWRAPYVGGALLAAAAIAAAAVPAAAVVSLSVPERPGATAAPRAGLGVLTLAGVLACTIVLSFSLGNWIATILDQAGTFGPIAAGIAGATVIGGSIVTRPLGGLLVERRPEAAPLLVVVALLAAAAGAATLALVHAPGLVLIAMVVLGLAAGLPFAAVVHAAAWSSPSRPGAAIGLVGTAGTLGGVVAIALLGLAVDADAVRETFAALALLAVLTAARFGVASAQARRKDGARFAANAASPSAASAERKTAAPSADSKV